MEDLYKPLRPGKLIICDGIDCSGKTTMSKLLAKDINASLFIFPNYDNITGKFIKYMFDKISYHSKTWATAMAMNRYEDEGLIRSALMRGNVVCNRYYMSNIAYSTASGIDTEWLFALDSGMPKPNLVIILDVPVQVSVDRKSNRDILENDLKYLQKVRETYLSLGPQMGWYIINGDQAPEDVHKEILKIVNHEFNWNI